MLVADRRTAAAAGRDWKAVVGEQIRKEIERGSPMTVERMCQLGGISRSDFYRMGSQSEGGDRDVELRDAIQRIAVEFPSYGRPRITQELRRRGWLVNPKKVYRILREDNLLCLRKRKFVVTTDSSHGMAIYPNLARERVRNGIDQLWVADITYVRLEVEFVYLAVILDAFSRRVIGWALDRTLEDSLTLSALGMALKQRQPKPDWSTTPTGASNTLRPTTRVYSSNTTSGSA